MPCPRKCKKDSQVFHLVEKIPPGWISPRIPFIVELETELLLLVAQIWTKLDKPEWTLL